MATLRELRARERCARSDWIDCLLRVEEMVSMRADEPERGCLNALREAQHEALEAGRKCRALQERIAALEGPDGELARRGGMDWPRPHR